MKNGLLCLSAAILTPVATSQLQPPNGDRRLRGGKPAIVDLAAEWNGNPDIAAAPIKLPNGINDFHVPCTPGLVGYSCNQATCAFFKDDITVDIAAHNGGQCNAFDDAKSTDVVPAGSDFHALCMIARTGEACSITAPATAAMAATSEQGTCTLDSQDHPHAICKPNPVDGQWGAWSACSVTCGDGHRFRQCDAPHPRHGGADCDGDAVEGCNLGACPVPGCTDSSANNFIATATTDDGSCVHDFPGCMDPSANNYSPTATTDDGSCTYDFPGCTDPSANNYFATATTDDGSCTYDNTTTGSGSGSGSGTYTATGSGSGSGSGSPSGSGANDGSGSGTNDGSGSGTTYPMYSS